MISRRDVLVRPVGLLTGGRAASAEGHPAPSTSGPASADEFSREAFGMVGVFDVDWLTDPRFMRVFETMAASPGAFTAVRFFGALNAGIPDKVFPSGGGGVWTSTTEKMDFSRPLDALQVLIDHDLVPFVVLTFFPPAVSASSIEPPPDDIRWKELVRGFLATAAGRFGAETIGTWWFEVWNEPNMPPFWRGTFDRYLALYRATAEAVSESGYAIRLGGPAIAYMPDQGAQLIERFLTFLSREPSIQCDFISFHRKGIWVQEETEPDLSRPVAAARVTAEAALRIDAARFRNMWVVNNEADMKVAFDTPYEPRMTEQFPAWLAALAIEYDRLTQRYAAQGIHFMAAADNCNQQLVQSPFDGRRALMMPVSDSLDDLVKLPVFNFYELLRLLKGCRGTMDVAQDGASSRIGLRHLVIAADTHIAALFGCYPSPFDPGASASPVDVTLRRIPWDEVNLIEFRIDASSNSYARWQNTPDPRARRRLAMQAQELGVARPPQRRLRVHDGTMQWRIAVGRFETALVWVTPVSEETPRAPTWRGLTREDNGVRLQWVPDRATSFYTYELFRRTGSGAMEQLGPMPLRGAVWTDIDALAQAVQYGVRSVSASGVGSEISWSAPV